MKIDLSRLSDAEIASVTRLASQQGLSYDDLCIVALRDYAHTQARLRSGETCEWSGDRARALKVSGNVKKSFTVWIEGYKATGQSAEAQYMGTFEGYCFLDACIAACEKFFDGDMSLFDEGTMMRQPSYWGCSMFDNEEDARKSYYR